MSVFSIFYGDKSRDNVTIKFLATCQNEEAVERYLENFQKSFADPLKILYSSPETVHTLSGSYLFVYENKLFN
jgi:hypothetical protein